MDKGDEKNIRGLEGVAQAARQAPGRGPAPVHLWSPAHCGDIDIVIRRDGVWMHEGSPIGRSELVRLFSTILRKDPDGYHLVTPGEKMRIQVEDLPFRAIAVERRGEALVFTTDVGDEVTADADHPIVVETNAASGEPLDKAGAYAVQGRAGAFVRSIHGSPTNVIGLPLETVARMLREAGWKLLG